LARCDDGKFEPIPAELMNELHGSGVRLHATLRDGAVHQVVLAIPEPVHGFDVCRVVKVSLWEVDTA
jgi:hypothetical protein